MRDIFGPPIVHATSVRQRGLWGRVSWLRVGMSVAVASTVCAVLVCGPPSAVGLASGPNPAASAPRLTWHTCAAPTPPGFECATIRVPLEYRHPHRPTIQLAVIRHPASDAAHRIGSVFFNPGGPGTSGLSILPSIVAQVPDQLKARFDWISWDPRGVGESTAVQCFSSYAAEIRFFGGIDPRVTFPVGRQEMLTWLHRFKRFGQLCAQRNGRLLRHISTADTARDLDRLRVAVGDRMLNYFGGSYGTLLGATYANLFPGRVRAMVLASNVAPNALVAPSGHAQSLSTFLRLHSDVGSTQTLRAFLDMCGRLGTARCAFSAGSASATETKFASLLRRLPRHPTHGLSYAELLTLTVLNLYDSVTWDKLGQQLQQLWSSARAASRPRSAVETAASPYAGGEQAWAILCSESPSPPASAFPGLDALALRRSGPLGPYWVWASAPCASWPAVAADRYSGPWNRRTADPILVIGNTYDPAAPYRNSVTMSHELARARLLTVDGYGHGAPSPCVQTYLTHYFIAGRLPPIGARCRQAPAPFTG